MKRFLFVLACIAWLVTNLLLSGCATAPAKDAPEDDDSRRVRVGGDITVTTVTRNGF